MPDRRALLKRLRKAGCNVSNTGSGHVRVVAPGGGVVILASTASDRRAWLNDRAHLRAAGLTI